MKFLLYCDASKATAVNKYHFQCKQIYSIFFFTLDREINEPSFQVRFKFSTGLWRR